LREKISTRKPQRDTKERRNDLSVVDISAENLIYGQPSGESQKTFQKWQESRINSNPDSMSPDKSKKDIF
jgi:hypothetical protein